MAQEARYVRIAVFVQSSPKTVGLLVRAMNEPGPQRRIVGKLADILVGGAEMEFHVDVGDECREYVHQWTPVFSNWWSHHAADFIAVATTDYGTDGYHVKRDEKKAAENLYGGAKVDFLVYVDERIGRTATEVAEGLTDAYGVILLLLRLAYRRPGEYQEFLTSFGVSKVMYP